MGLVVGLLLGVGLFCVWWSCWAPSEPVRRGSRLLDRARDVMVQAGADQVSLPALALTCVAVAVAVLVAVWAVSGAPAIAVCFAAMAGWSPVGLVRARARRRRSALRELWPEVVDNLSSGVRAGLALPEALSQLAERGPQEVRPAFGRFSADYRATGRFTSSLEELKAALADPVADRLVEALRITREVGGSDLGRLLRTLSAFLREDARTRNELQARQSWTVNAARLAVAAPWLVLALLAGRAGAVAAYNRPEGVLVLAVGAGVSLLAYRLMVRLGRLPEEERVLR